MIPKEKLKTVLDFINSTDLDYIQIEKDNKKFLLRRQIVSAPVDQTVDKEDVKAPEAAPLAVIRSPMVGRFLSSNVAGAPPLVVEGGEVSSGRRVAMVEAMGIKKEVFSTVTGKVVRVHVREGDAVEYGQELFSVEESV